jgi:hypothetical protein
MKVTKKIVTLVVIVVLTIPTVSASNIGSAKSCIKDAKDSEYAAVQDAYANTSIAYSTLELVNQIQEQNKILAKIEKQLELINSKKKSNRKQKRYASWAVCL